MKSRHFAFRLLTLTAVLAFSALCPVRANTIWYVKASNGTSGNGLSWTNAFVTVDEAIAHASTTRDAQGHSDEIWVAQGSYFPSTGSTGFYINKPLALYGGFKGSETSVQGRLGSFVQTILDGNIGTNPPSTNAAHVVSISGVAGVSGTPGVVIDGFLIQNGYASGTGVNGAGISSSITDLDLANCFVRTNRFNPFGTHYGGGLYFTSASGGLYPTVGYTLHIKNSEFSGNRATEGGGIYGDDLRGEVVNTKFLENLGLPDGGGAYLTRMGSSNRLDFTNCVFWENVATYTPGLGAGLYLAEIGGDAGGNAQLVNCTFSDNSSSYYPNGMAMTISTNSQATIYNSIFFWNGSDGTGNYLPIAGPATVNYSDVEGGWTGTGSNNKNADPLFAKHQTGMLTLLLSPTPSPCLDAADYSRLPADDLDVDGDGNLTEIIPLDIGSQTRLVDQTSITDTGVGSSSCSSCTYLDMGAYELP
jgi:hypothetical protein